MFARFNLSRVAFIAFIFLAAGAARPAVLLVESFLPRTAQDMTMCNDDLEDSQEQEDTNDNETDSDDVVKIMTKRVSITFSASESTLSSTAYSLVFKEHHPEIITPPPKA